MAEAEVLNATIVDEETKPASTPVQNTPPAAPPTTVQPPIFGDSGSVVVTQGEKGKRYTAVITGEVSFPGKYIQLIDTLYHAKKGDSIVIKIASPGGMVETGVAILTAIENTQAHVTTVAMGLVASIAAIIWLAGNDRKMLPGSTLMVHGPSGLQAGKVSDIKEECEQIDSYFRNMVTQLTKGVLTDEQLQRVLENREDLFLPWTKIETQMGTGKGVPLKPEDQKGESL